MKLSHGNTGWWVTLTLMVALVATAAAVNPGVGGSPGPSALLPKQKAKNRLINDVVRIFPGLHNYEYLLQKYYLPKAITPAMQKAYAARLVASGEWDAKFGNRNYHPVIQGLLNWPSQYRLQRAKKQGKHAIDYGKLYNAPGVDKPGSERKAGRFHTHTYDPNNSVDKAVLTHFNTLKSTNSRAKDAIVYDPTAARHSFQRAGGG